MWVKEEKIRSWWWGWGTFPTLVIHLIEALPWIWNDFVLSIWINGDLTIDVFELDNLMYQQCSGELLKEVKSLSWLMLFICRIDLFMARERVMSFK